MSANRQDSRLANYVTVAERVAAFYEDWPVGRILTAIIEHDQEKGFVLMRAEVYRELAEVTPSATGHAFEVRGEGHVNRTSYIENCETGAVGRALANLGMETKREPVKATGPTSVARMPATAQEPEPRSADDAALKRRHEQVLHVNNVAQELNANLKRLGREPVWSPKYLREYVNRKFQVEDGVNSLSFATLKELLADLNTQLDALLTEPA